MGASADVVRAYFGSLSSGDVETVVKYWHPEITWRAIRGAADDSGVMRGHEELRNYYQDWVDMLDDLRGDVDEVLLEDGERVVVSIRNSGRGRASGVPVEGRYYVDCTVRDGLVFSGREYATAEEATAP